MKIFVKNQEVTAVEFSTEEKISSLKEKVDVSESSCLSFADQIFDDEATLADAGICSQAATEKLSMSPHKCQLISFK